MLVVESKDLSLPSPSQVAVAQVRDIIVPRARRLRVDIEERADIQAAREMCRQLEAFRGYLRDRKGRDLLAAECRRTEVLIGKMLGPGEVGANQYTELSPAWEGMPKNDRHRFRLLAEHEELVEQLLEKGIVNRKPILQQILWQDAAESQANDESLEGRRVKTLEELSGQKFSCIYADPPWRYGNQATRGSTRPHYTDTMTVEEIAALPVRELAADQCHLWLWTTNAFLFECPRIFAAWGFEFKASYVWVKPQVGIGNYIRNSHEFLLIAVRGGLTSLTTDAIRSWGEFDRGAHSAKPEAIRREVIEKISPSPRLELFGRKDIGRGWIVWGNQEDHPLFAGK